MKKLLDKRYLALGCLIALIGGLLLLGNFFNQKYDLDNRLIENVSASSSNEEKEEEQAKEEPTEFYVDVKGAVSKPGVYKVSKGMIVNDAIKLAGGVTSKANTNNINLSKALTNEMVIHVFTKTEVSKLTQKNEIPCSCEVVEVNNCVNSNSSSSTTNDNASTSGSTSTGSETSTQETINGKVNINTASKEELMKLTGIGEAKAKAIIEYRSKTRFNTIEDIKKVNGIGDAMFAKIKDDITV